MMERIKIVVERHADGFVAYPLGVNGSVVGEGSTAEAAVEDVQSALKFHVDTFGADALATDPVLDAFLVDGAVSIG